MNEDHIVIWREGPKEPWKCQEQIYSTLSHAIIAARRLMSDKSNVYALVSKLDQNYVDPRFC